MELKLDFDDVLIVPRQIIGDLPILLNLLQERQLI